MIDALADAWLDHCRAEHKPPNTIAARARTMRSVGNPGTATREQIEAWWYGPHADLSPATRSSDLANLRSFYKWCRRWDHRDDDPTLRLDAPDVDKGVPRPMSRADLHRLLAELPDDLRRAVALGAYAGLRVSEAAALDWAEVDEETRTVHVLGTKGTVSRSVKVSPVLIDHLLPRSVGNVVTGTAGQLSPATFQRRINRAIKRVNPNATYHRLRHRFGMLAYGETGDLLGVATAMGHRSIESTRTYASSTTEVAERIAAAVVR